MALISGPVDFSKPLDLARLRGRAALVTGGASGIGAGAVAALAQNGVFVTIADINATNGAKLESELRAEGHKVQFVQTDVTDWQSQLNAFKVAYANSPSKSLDIVLACAGISGPSLFDDPPFSVSTNSSGDPVPPVFQLAAINVNLIGTMYTTTLATWFWKQRASPATDNVLVVIASNIAYFATAGFTGYTGSKWGVRGLWKSLRGAPSFAPLFRTNLLAPHIVRSPMTAGLQPILDAQGLKMVEIEDCVKCLLRFCCDESIRGRAVQVNPEGSWFDLCDDAENFDGSKVFQEHWEETRPVFDFMDPSRSMS